LSFDFRAKIASLHRHLEKRDHELVVRYERTLRAQRDRLERLMWTKVGVVRNGKDMQQAIPEIQDIRERIKRASGSVSSPALDSRPSTLDPRYNAPWNETINTENLSLIAEMLTRSALAREESRGSHYRSDFPYRDDDLFQKHSLAQIHKEIAFQD